MTGLVGAQCTATSKRSGVRCKRMVVGGGVCVMHGGNAPQVRAAREARVAAAEAFRAAPRSTREAGEILIATMQDGDTIYQHLYERFANGTATDADFTAMASWVDRTNRLAKTVLDAGVDERRLRLAEDQGRMVAQVISTVLAGMLAVVLDAVADESTRLRLQAVWQSSSRQLVQRELRAVLPAEVVS